MRESSIIPFGLVSLLCFLLDPPIEGGHTQASYFFSYLAVGVCVILWRSFRTIRMHDVVHTWRRTLWGKLLRVEPEILFASVSSIPTFSESLYRCDTIHCMEIWMKVKRFFGLLYKGFIQSVYIELRINNNSIGWDIDIEELDTATTLWCLIVWEWYACTITGFIFEVEWIISWFA